MPSLSSAPNPSSNFPASPAESGRVSCSKSRIDETPRTLVRSRLLCLLCVISSVSFSRRSIVAARHKYPAKAVILGLHPKDPFLRLLESRFACLGVSGMDVRSVKVSMHFQVGSRRGDGERVGLMDQNTVSCRAFGSFRKLQSHTNDQGPNFQSDRASPNGVRNTAISWIGSWISRCCYGLMHWPMARATHPIPCVTSIPAAFLT